MRGVDRCTVQERPGHADIPMTLRYSHVSAAHLLHGVEKLGAGPGSTDTSTSGASTTAPDATPGTQRNVRIGPVVCLIGELLLMSSGAQARRPPAPMCGTGRFVTSTGSLLTAGAPPAC
jgi:hypothetical protein